MATQEKLQKSLDFLKNLSQQNKNNADQSKKKEKIQYCHIITESISNSAIRVSTNFHSLLGSTVEVFLLLCDDDDADIRMTSEECLNKIIRAANGYIGKIQIELHKEIKKNGSPRSLRIALSLFSQLAHRIRPHKGKPYVSNLFPSLIKIAERTEEPVHETLANGLPKIMKALGCFATEHEIKVLLKAFLSNICNDSAVIRRTTTNCILTICLFCKNPYAFIIYCLNHLLDNLLPVNANSDHSTSQILGIIPCIRSLIPNIFSVKKEFHTTDELNLSEKLLQIFEVCLYYLSHKDHNIVNVCLETLKVVLECPSMGFRKCLLNSEGFECHRIYVSEKTRINLSSSQLSVATTVNTDDNLFSESELTETLHSDIEKWIDESKLSVMNVNFAKTKEKSRSLDKINRFDSTISVKSNICFDEDSNKLNRDNYTSKSVDNTLDSLDFSNNSSEKSSNSDEKLLNNEELLIQDIDYGSLLDHDIPLKYCIRLITKLFLLNGVPGNFISDKHVRVSVKHLAISCLSTIFELYPEGIFMYLDKNYAHNLKQRSSQRIFDVLLLRNHPDPQLRGAVRNLLATVIKVVSNLYSSSYDEWIDKNSEMGDDVLKIQTVIDIFVEGLKDESATCIRQTLLALNKSLKYLLESNKSYLVLSILNILPELSANPYWLVKVSLCELVANINYIAIYYITENNDFQDKILYNVLFNLLTDSDQRVRTAAASGIKQIVPALYYSEYLNEDTSISKAILETNELSKCLKHTEVDSNISKKHFVMQMPFPYNKVIQEPSDRIDFSLSKIIYKLSNILFTTTDKNLLNGCIETLCLLTNAYPCTIYKNSWSTLDFQMCDELKTPDLLKYCLSLLTNSTQVYGLQTHIDTLKLLTNLYAGHSIALLKPFDLEGNNSPWCMFSNNIFADISEQFLSHTIKLLCIFHHILNDLVPVHPQTKPVLSNLPNTSNLSPLKRRKSDLDKKSLTLKLEKDDKKDIKTNYLGVFVQSGHYMKIYETVKASFINYKISLDSVSSKTFLEFLNTTIKALSVILEVASLTEFGKLAEEILGYFRSTFVVDAPATIEGVQQLLKCLFGTNLAANSNEFALSKHNEKNWENGFHYNIIQKPLQHVSVYNQLLNNISRHDFENDNTVMGYLHRKDVKRRSVILTRTSDKILADYIRIFEPMVIKSLKQYTVTSNIELQCQVLQLLSQLVQLRVNYCLLDSEQVFIGFVLKQFEFIEEGQIQCVEQLILKIFQFLVQLSYSKQHSKSIIGIPKIIQLCDGLMASGQPAATHCIPALEPIVEDIFLTRNKSNATDFKELETTREVVLSMLLRLCDNKQILSLITLILDDSKYCTHNTIKWYEWSKRVFQVIIPLLKQNKLKLDDSESLLCMRRFVLALNPEVFKPFDEIIVMFFQELPTMDADSITFNNWFSKIIILLLLIMLLPEDTLLAKINRLKSEFSPSSIFENVTTKADPLNVNNNADTFLNIPGESIFVTFLFRVLNLSTKRCIFEKENEFITEQVFAFLVHCSYLFQSGNYIKMTKTASSIVNSNISDNINLELKNINENFFKLGVIHPVITTQWFNLLALLNCDNRIYWETIIVDKLEFGKLKNPALGKEIMKIGSSIVLCELLSENSSNIDTINWFLGNSSKLLIDFNTEPPVTEFLSIIHQSSELSRKFTKEIEQVLKITRSSVCKIKALDCMENCHQNQIGTILKILIPDVLKYHQSAVSRKAANLASRKIETLLTLTIDEVHNQLSTDDLNRIQNDLINFNIVKKHENLVGFLNKLSTQFYDLSPIEFEQHRVVNPDYIKNLKVDKNWYLTQIQIKSKDPTIGRFIAELLNKIEYDEIVRFMSNEDFNKQVIRDCLRLGLFELENKSKIEDGSDLLRASIYCFLNEMSNIVAKIPLPHQVFSPVGREPNISECTYKEKLIQLFDNEQISNLIYSLAKSVPIFSENIFRNYSYVIQESHLEDLIKFSVLCLEYVHYLESQSRDFRVHLTDICLTACNSILKNFTRCNFLSLDSNITWLCSSINSLFSLVNTLLRNDKPLLAVPKYNLKEDTSPVEATHQLYILTCWIFDLKCINSTRIPDFLFNRIKSLVVCLGRLPLVNNYLLIPYRAWKTGWIPDRMEGAYKTIVSVLPIDMLQDIDILHEYIFRVNMFGFTSKKQFEETWMCLLSVLCAPIENLDILEQNEVLHASSMAMKTITTILLDTLLYPVIGDPNTSKLMHISRNSTIEDNTVSIQKLKTIQNCLQISYHDSSHNIDQSDINNVFNLRNFEKITKNYYSCGQVSVKYMLIATKSVEEININLEVINLYKQRLKRLETMGLDVNSCLQFLIDYYTQLMKPQSRTPIRVLHEVIKSTTVISDLFTDKSQFNWMLDVFLELSKIHHLEDEFIHQYLVLGICKAVAVLSPDIEIYEQLKKMLVQYLKSPYLTSRLSSLYGLLYILEGCLLSNIKLGGISEEMQLILPCAVEYVQFHLNSSNNVLKKSQEHTSLVWSLAFYLVENVDEVHMEQNFVFNVMTTAFSNLTLKNPSWFHILLIKGLERLLIVKKKILLEIFGKQYLKLALDKMKSDNPTVALLGTQLLLSYMYTQFAGHLQSVQTYSNIPTNPDHLVQTIETLSAIFERIKKGYVYEVEILCSVLPNILSDFFSPADILTKVIGEFLSPHQPHPKLLSKVVFQVFQSVIHQNQLSLLQDWVVFSLSNFTQSFSIGMATWCLICFFVSASTNDWLRSYFPYIQTRVGRYDYEDKKMLCIAGADFYKNLTSDNQRKTFVDNFNKVKDQPDTPFNDLLLSL